ncbi:MAG: hypothetical protein IPF55_12030 [Rhodoferax sp.]|nr:hypothetical protein [Rhodoferax sp.]
MLLASCLLSQLGCTKPETKYSATLERASLMLLPFPTWNAGGAGRVQRVDLSATATEKNKANFTAVRAEITPLYVVRLDDSHAVLLTQALPVGEGDQPYACHACAGTIGAYFFAHNAAGWRQTKRHDALATSGVEGNLGETSIAKLADGHYAMTAEWGSCWQGYYGSWLVIAGLQADTAVVLAPGLPLAADNDGAYGACSALDTPRDTDDKTEDNHECLDITAEWKFQGNRLVVTFETA